MCSSILYKCSQCVRWTNFDSFRYSANYILLGGYENENWANKDWLSLGAEQSISEFNIVTFIEEDVSYTQINSPLNLTPTDFVSAF